ncbi:serine hydrolase [Microlunatus soli]|uniref:Dipeptidyl aminopeptidase/acylaminoacyl peptidase n=1 Tax=Microlunatus soli TaxID=630515 RepID=A0A1H1UC91_9ACTN|nr:serine hydrolase [Microlunatus soli]SDS70125.1 Dipeptidyl aminopeptidase/acylaminoacyl peptidase [Microlunatus soli]
MSRRLLFDDLSAIRVPTAVTIDPDGTRVVYAVRGSDPQTDTNPSTLWSRSTTPDARPSRCTSGEADSDPQFSPDGSRILFLRSGDAGPQLWLITTDGTDERRLTEPDLFPYGVASATWSPDGSRIAVIAAVGVHSDPHAPLVADRIGYKADGAGYLGELRTQLFMIKADTGTVTRLTSSPYGVTAPAWSPDGTRIAYVTATDDPRSDITAEHVVEYLTVAERTLGGTRIGHATGVSGPLVWRPNGASVIAVGRPDVSIGHGLLIMLHLDVTKPDRILTESTDRNVMPGMPGYPGAGPVLSADGRSVLFCLRERGWSHLHRVSIVGRAKHPAVESLITDDHQVVSGLSVATSAAVAAVLITDQRSFGEVALIDLETGELTPLSALTADALPDIDLFTAEQRTFGIDDGQQVHGWLLRDPDHAQPGPLLLDIHGGPHNAWSGVADPAHLYHQVLAEQGWTILTLNPRGSDGYGEDFYRAVVGGWGSRDSADFLQPIDTLISEGVADPQRLAVTGYSYGGFSTCRLTADTDRFAAAVAGGLLCDFADFAGGSDIGALMTPLEVAGDQPLDRQGYAERSPIAQVSQVTTPTLILHGADDQRCPVNQAEQWFVALRSADVPTRLVTYPGASHLFIIDGRPSHRLDYNRRLVDWLQRYPSATTRPAGRVPAGLGSDHWQRRLDDLREHYQVPGAQFGVLELTDDGRELTRTVVGSGVLNATTGAAATPDALFQIGSITKVWTTVMIMQLVDEGKLDLDLPVRKILPELNVLDESVAAEVTTRHLLTHTSGIDGDLFTDTGRGDDAVRAYVDTLADAAQLHPLGKGWSYCNSGFVIAGRLIEVLREQTWDQVLRTKIIEPLGLKHCVTLPEEAIRYAAAIGHGVTPDGAVPVPTWGIPRSMGPAGLINSSAGDLLSFAGMMLRGGVAADGTRILSADAAAQMATPQYRVADLLDGMDAWGLGWWIEDWHGTTVLGHNGGTIGQSAFLRLFPDQRVAIALLTNGGVVDGLSADLFAEAADLLTGLTPPDRLLPPSPSPAVSLAGFPGEYRTAWTTAAVERKKDSLSVTVTQRAVVPGAEQPPTTLDLVPVSDGVFASRPPGAATWGQAVFRTDPDGSSFLQFGARRLPRTSADG